jgi:hypothetical protein
MSLHAKLRAGFLVVVRLPVGTSARGGSSVSLALHLPRPSMSGLTSVLAFWIAGQKGEVQAC